MAEPIRDPSQNVKRNILVSGQNVADVGAIENVLQRRQHSNPDSRAPVTWNEPATVVSDYLRQSRKTRLQLTGKRRKTKATQQ